MKPYDSDEELERALFALPLEEPPADLRASILAKTVYRAPAPFAAWETWLLGAACALLAWLLVMLARGTAMPAFDGAVNAIGNALAVVLQPQVLFWIAIGGGATFWISQLNLTPAAGASRIGRR